MAIDIRVNFCQFDALGRQFGADGVLKSMQKYNIETAVLLSSVAVNCDFALGNKELFEVVKSDDRLFGYLIVNPNYPEESIRMMRSAMNSRKFPAAAFFQGATRPYPNVDDYREILNAYRRYTKPVYVETTHAEAVDAAVQMAREFPTIKFILGSMGGGDWKRAMNYNKQLNIFLETSGSFDVEKIETAAASLGAHRVLFGSNLPYADPASILALIQSSSVSQDAMSKILGENAKRLFGLDRPATVEGEET